MASLASRRSESEGESANRRIEDRLLIE